VRRRDLIKRIQRQAKQCDVLWEIEREGARHTVYQLGQQRIPIPRHTEIGPHLTEQILKETEPELGRRWWR
jgi:hypothetical protein